MLASAMQEAYRNFFRNKMQEAGITAPSITQLGSRRAVAEFFNSIKEEWPVAKKAVEAKFAKALKDVKVGKNGKATLMASDYDYEPDFDVDHFLVNINSSEYDYLCDEFDEYDNTSESSGASLEAKKLKLIKIGFGRYATAKEPDKVAYITVHGRLCKAHIANKIKKVAQAIKHISKQHAEVIGKNSNKVMRLENKAKKLLSTLEKHDPIHAKKIQWNVLKGGNRRMYDSMNQKSTSATMSKDYDSKEAKRLLSKVEDSSGALLNYMINGVNDDPKLENAIDELSLECEHVLKKIKFIIGKL